MKLTDLRTQYRRNPLGLEELCPVFSWKWETDETCGGCTQSAWRIQVADSRESLEKGEANAWDSGKVSGEAPFGMRYGGRRPESRERLYWRAMAWDDLGCGTEWSESAWFEMGLLEESDWEAQWIGRSREEDATPLFRKVFQVREEEIRKVRLYGCGLGLADVFLNGEKTDRDYYEPWDTDYRKTVYYKVWNLDGMLRPGENVLGIWLGNGQYRNYEEVYTLPARYQKTDGWREKDSGFYGDAKGILQLEIWYADGSIQRIVTDESWQYADSPLLFSNWYGGEDYDSRLEIEDWCLAGCRYGGWEQAVRKEPPMGKLKAKDAPPIGIVEELIPVDIYPIKNGHYIVDMGKNSAGFEKLILRDTTPDMAGQRIILYPAETLGPDGSVDQYSCTQGDPGVIYDTYWVSGKGTEEWSPRFCYHGFRYLEVEGFPGVPDKDNFRGYRLRALNERTGSFETSDEVLSAIDRITTRSIECNMMSVFTDCPQIEKLGWLETTNLMFFSMSQSYDIRAWMEKILQDILDSQYENGYIPAIAPEFQRISGLAHDPNWSGVCALMPWDYYEAYGDAFLLEMAYPVMTRYVAYLEEETRPDKYILYHIQMGDWGAFDTTTPKELVGSCAFYNIVDITSRTAALLQKPQDAEKYRLLAEQIKFSINRRFRHPESGVYGSGSEASYACPLYAGVVEERDIPRTVELLVEEVRRKGDHLSTGEVGLKQLFAALARYGRSDVVYRIVTNRTQPSYWYFVDQGATTLPEYWDMNRSQNHAMMGHVKEWLSRYLAGIDFLEPGYRKIRMRPYMPEGVDYAQATVPCPYGQISFAWKRGEEGIACELDVPFGTRAQVWLPADGVCGLIINGKPGTQDSVDGDGYLEAGMFTWGRYSILAKKSGR